jgi:Domain of unknown function (DUF1772)
MWWQRDPGTVVDVNARLARACALLTTGLLAGAFLYGWAVVVPTFGSVPLEVHLAFRTELMKRNATVMQVLMAAALTAAAWYASTLRGRARWTAGAAAVLVLASVLITRLGNVPINLEIKAWARAGLPGDYDDRLRVWDGFNDARVATAVGALVLLVVAVDRSRVRTTAVAGETRSVRSRR